MEPGLLRLLLAIDDLQAELGVSGALAEVGVYHGKSFAPLALLRRPGETCVAVDCFDAQEHNVDESGVGSRDAFLRNLEAAARECADNEGNEEEEETVGADDDEKEHEEDDEEGWLAIIEGDSTAVDAGNLTNARRRSRPAVQRGRVSHRGGHRVRRGPRVSVPLTRTASCWWTMCSIPTGRESSPA